MKNRFKNNTHKNLNPYADGANGGKIEMSAAEEMGSMRVPKPVQMLTTSEGKAGSRNQSNYNSMDRIQSPNSGTSLMPPKNSDREVDSCKKLQQLRQSYHNRGKLIWGNECNAKFQDFIKKQNTNFAGQRKYLKNVPVEFCGEDQKKVILQARASSNKAVR